jgi:phosphate:Na+ symporter
VPAKRTALALVLLNSGTGVIALVMLPFFLWAIRWAQQHLALDAGAASLAAFHTLFAALGVALFLPPVERFAHWVERLIPDQAPALTARLDKSLLNVPSVALEATRRALNRTAAELAVILSNNLDGESDAPGHKSREFHIQQALRRSREFFEKIPPITDDQGVSRLRVALLHAFDHLARLEGYLHPPANIRRVLRHDRLKHHAARCRDLLELVNAGFRGNTPDGWLTSVERLARELAEYSHSERPALLRQTASGAWQPQDALDVLDGMRWLSRVANHAWRASYYLSGMEPPEDGTEGEEPS